MALASLEDVNNWLNFSDEKLSLDDVNLSGPQLEAQRLIKSALAGVFDVAIITTWDSPDTTPGIVRNIAGELVAAYVYRDAYSEDNPDVVEYAQQLYNEATEKLKEVRDGTLILVDVDDNVIELSGLQLTSDNFWPNDTTPGPYFTMDQVL